MLKKQLTVSYPKKFLLAFFAVSLVLFILLYLSSLIPSPYLKSSVGGSVKILKHEGVYPSYGVPGRQIVLDNYTDALMINTAYSVDSFIPVRSAISGTRHTKEMAETNQVINLEKTYNQEAKTPISYERYWHGYLIYLRPLLVVLPYSGIRIILSLLLYGLTAIFLYTVWRKLGLHDTIIFFIGFLSVDLFYLGQSMQFSGVFLIALASSLYLLKKKKQGSEYLLFFITGMLTSFIDLLTAPLVTVGLLLVTTYLLDKKRNVFLHFGSWYVGYVLFWFSKLLIAQLLYFPNALSSGLWQFTNRLVNKADANFSQLSAVKLNAFQLIGYAKQSKIAILTLFIGVVLFFLRYHVFKKESLKKAIPLLIIGVIPYLWYLIVANHSYLHVWYTYRDQMMSVLAFFLILSELTNWKKVHSDWTRLNSAPGKQPKKS